MASECPEHVNVDLSDVGRGLSTKVSHRLHKRKEQGKIYASSFRKLPRVKNTPKLCQECIMA